MERIEEPCFLFDIKEENFINIRENKFIVRCENCIELKGNNCTNIKGGLEIHEPEFMGCVNGKDFRDVTSRCLNYSSHNGYCEAKSVLITQHSCSNCNDFKPYSSRSLISKIIDAIFLRKDKDKDLD